MPFVKGQSGNPTGRKVGSTTKPQIKDFITKKEIKELVLLAKKKARSGDTNLVKFLLEQLFGKAPQTIEAIVTNTTLLDLLLELDERKRIRQNRELPTESNKIHSNDVEVVTPTVKTGVQE